MQPVFSAVCCITLSLNRADLFDGPVEVQPMLEGHFSLYVFVPQNANRPFDSKM